MQQALFLSTRGSFHISAARAILDKNLPNRWIGRRGPIEWPPRSPDLSTSDIFLWGTSRDSVHVRRPKIWSWPPTFLRILRFSLATRAKKLTICLFADAPFVLNKKLLNLSQFFSLLLRHFPVMFLDSFSEYLSLVINEIQYNYFAW